jgi:hypothetical protein
MSKQTFQSVGVSSTGVLGDLKLKLWIVYGDGSGHIKTIIAQAKCSGVIYGLLRHILSASNHKMTVPRIPKTKAKRL